jgi:hypothetical protein
MTEDRSPEEMDEAVEDLDVPAEEAEDVKGGIKGESLDDKHKGEIHIESFRSSP